MEKINTARVVKTAAVAAVYVVCTVFLTPYLSYEMLQVRIAEVLILLCFYNKDYCVSMIIGCFIANLFSPLGLIDVVIGTAATAISAALITRAGNIWVAAMLPVLLNSVLVGWELAYVFKSPLLINMAFVALGEFIAVVVIGAPLFAFALAKNRAFMRLIGGNMKL